MQDIRSYIENLFSIYENSPYIENLKEEMILSLSQKYEDYLSEGYGSDEAFGKVIREFGDISEIRDEIEDYQLKSTPKKKKPIRFLKDGIMTLSVAVFLYTGLKYDMWLYNWIIFILAAGINNLIDYKMS